MSIAIHYTPIKLPGGREKEILGLQVAIADWLKAYLRHARTEKFSFLIGDAEEWREVQALAAEVGVDPSRLVAFDRRFPEQNLAQFSTVFRVDPDTRKMLWHREAWARQGASFSFCGLAHAISGTEAGDVLREYCLAPSRNSDAIICPSRAVGAAVRSFWDSYGDYLTKRFGAAYRCPVQLPVIPLGIDVEKFAAKTTPDKRKAQRQKLGVGENDIVLLWVGRLSAAIKAHPLAMFQAAEQAAQKTGARVHLLMLGYFVPHEAEGQFKKLAADLMAKAQVSFIAANDPRFPDGLWAAGDIFLSLIDNMQESFGLTPIEAMAAGLPRVISDWDGYRDSVTEGEDGFLIRTMQPPAGNGFDLTAQVLSGREVYGGFLAKTALTVAVDAAQAGDRIARLIQHPNLRARMAEKAKARVQAVYDWRHIIPAYESLWQELAEQRGRDVSPSAAYGEALPELPDPYTMYESYPTSALALSDRLSLAVDIGQIKTLWGHHLNTYAGDVLLPPQDLSALVGWVGENKDARIEAVLARFPAGDTSRVWRTIAWLQKLGIFKNSACQESAGE